MESRLKQDSIHSYAKEFSGELVNSFFGQKEKISGAEILKLSKIHQINLFVIMHLFQTWEEESRRLKSPYFNYEHPDVKQAMIRFQNSLSNHIEIAQNDFLPLLEAAVEKTLNLIFSPYHFYIERFSKLNDIQADDLDKLMKYIRINPGLLTILIENMDKEKSYSSDELVKLFDEVCAESPAIPEDFEGYLQAFSKVKPLSLEMIYSEEEETEPISSEPEPISSKPEPEPTESNNIAQAEVEAEKAKTLNDKFNKEQKTLNDQIKAKLDSTLAEIHQNKKIDNLLKSVSINQRYLFTKELFKGNKDELEESLKKLDSMKDLETAVSYSEEVATRLQWDMESDEVVEFMLLVRRRFHSEDPI